MGELEVQNHSAQYYDQRYTSYGLRYHTRLIRWLMAEAHGRILDAGCGTGIVSRLYPDADIVGIDPSPGMRAKHPGYCLDEDVCHLPERWTASFDFVLCRSLLHHLPTPRDGVHELHRVLKRHGQMAVLETNQSWLATKIRAWTQHGDRFSAYHHAFRDADLLALLGTRFQLDEVRYFGFLSYPLYGFPDIIDFSRWLPGNPFLYPLTQGVDACLSRLPLVRRLSWALGIKAHKR